MEQLGHATNSTFRRYDITTTDDLQDAADKLTTYRSLQRKADAEGAQAAHSRGESPS